MSWPDLNSNKMQTWAAARDTNIGQRALQHWEGWELRHLPSDIDKAVLEATDSISGAVNFPDSLVEDVALHAKIVAKGSVNFADMMRRAVARYEPLWSIYPHGVIPFAKMGEEEMITWMRKSMNLENPHDHLVWPVDAGQHATFIIKPSGVPRLIYYDPDTDGRDEYLNHRRPLKAKKVFGNALEIVNNAIQTKLSSIHQVYRAEPSASYGMCGYLCCTVLRRTMAREVETGIIDPYTAAEELYDAVKGNKILARKLDYWMIGSALRIQGVTTRIGMMMPAKTQNERNAEMFEEYLDAQEALQYPNQQAWHAHRIYILQQEYDAIREKLRNCHSDAKKQLTAKRIQIFHKIKAHESKLPSQYPPFAPSLEPRRLIKAGSISRTDLLLLTGLEKSLWDLGDKKRSHRKTV